MADISQYLQAIMSAVYGEDVRGSIHDAISIINDVGEKVLTLGTDITSTSSPTTGYFKDSVYLNTDTDDLWVCTGNEWVNSGSVKGDKGDDGADGEAATISVGTVTSGATPSITNSGTSSAAVFDFVLPKGDKGDTGDSLTANSSHSGTNTTVNILNASTSALINSFQVPDGAQGPSGNGIASITKIGTSGLVDTYQIVFTDGTTFNYTVTNGEDGTGAGDMTKATYDPNDAVANAGGIPAYVSAHAGATYTGEKGVIVAGTTIKAALMNDSASSLASANISTTQNRQYAVGLDSNNKLSVNVPWETPTIDQTYNSTSTNPQSGTAVAGAVDGKADKVTSATNGNFAGLDSNGNLTDSGSKASDFLTSLPTASTSTLGGVKIDGTSITIDANGVISSQGGGSSTLAGLSDTDISSPTDGQILQYDDTSGKWINSSSGSVANKVNKTDVAPIESGSTASQAYAIGQQFYLNGSLYKATAAIAQGATFTIGTNCVAADCITEQIGKRVLLWTNPNPSQDYPSGAIGDIVLDNKYDYYLILVKPTPGREFLNWYIVDKENNNSNSKDKAAFLSAFVYNGTRFLNAYRLVFFNTAENNKLHSFGGNYVDSTWQQSTDNSYMIPIKVYGVKL